MKREEFVPWAVLAQVAGLNACNEVGVIHPYRLVAQANEFADALYGPAKQVESEEVLGLREAFVEVYNWLDQITEKPMHHPNTNTLMGARAMLDGCRGIYDECCRVLRGEDDDAC